MDARSIGAWIRNNVADGAPKDDAVNLTRNRIAKQMQKKEFVARNVARNKPIFMMKQKGRLINKLWCCVGGGLMV